MTVRVQNAANMNFGTFGAATTVTHARIKDGNTVLGTRALSASVTIPQNREFQIPANSLDFVFPEGHFSDAGMQEIAEAYFTSSKQLEVELLTNANTEVTTSGYSSQTTSSWSISTE